METYDDCVRQRKCTLMVPAVVIKFKPQPWSLFPPKTLDQKTPLQISVNLLPPDPKTEDPKVTRPQEALASIPIRPKEPETRRKLWATTLTL